MDPDYLRCMNGILPTRLTVDEFLGWAKEQENGRFELEGGRILKTQSQNIAHLRSKARILPALEAAIARAGAPYYALPDGATVPITGDRAYEPDGLVAPLPLPVDETLEITNPIIIVEVFSPTPSSIKRDLVTKLRGYAKLPSIEHYIVVDPAERAVIRFRRSGEDLVLTEELGEGSLRLDPPGLEIPVADMLLPKNA